MADDEALDPTPGKVAPVATPAIADIFNPPTTIGKFSDHFPLVMPELVPDGVKVPSGRTVQFVQEDGTEIRCVVLHVGADGSLLLLTPTGQQGGIPYGANGAPNSWHEAE